MLRFATTLTGTLKALRYMTSTKKVMFSSSFVCSLAGLLKKTAQSIFTKFGGKAAHGPLKKQLDLGGNPDHATLWLG